MIKLKEELNDLVEELNQYPKEVDGYCVSLERRKIQLICLDLLLEFKRICDKYGLKYVLDAGTLLGCCRHKGFIPWDDDVDVKLPREDYEKFKKVVRKEIDTTRYYFQDTYDLTNTLMYCRIRMLGTHCATNFIKKHLDSIRDGIFIDIQPCDYIPVDEEEYQNHLNHLRELREKLNFLFKVPDDERHRRYIKVPYIYQEKALNIINQFQKEVTKYNKDFYKNPDNYTLSCSGTILLDNLRMPLNDIFYKTIDGEFEGFKFKIPKEYDKTLTYIFDENWSIPQQLPTNHPWKQYDLGDGKFERL